MSFFFPFWGSREMRQLEQMHTSSRNYSLYILYIMQCSIDIFSLLTWFKVVFEILIFYQYELDSYLSN